MGAKALLYFEIVTTIALFIGLGDREPHQARRRCSVGRWQ
jgi:hypothetical protein